MRTAGFWPPLMRHQPDARELRDLLRQRGVGEVFDLGQRQRVGGSASVRIGRVGRIDLAVDRRVGQVARQIGGGRVDGRLHLLLGDVDVLVRG